MLKFEPFSVEALKRVQTFLQKNTSLCSDHASGAIFMWHSPDARFCVYRDTFVVHQTVGGQPAFSYPVGADPDGMIEEILTYVRENRLPIRFYAVDEKTLDTIRADERLKPATWDYDERWSDYIYSFPEAMTFQGRKYSGQRNHINKFKRLYGEPIIRSLKPEDTEKLEVMLSEYEKTHPPKNKMEEKELAHTKRLLTAYKELGLPAACLTIGEEIAAFSIGEVVGDMLLIHVEKALTRYAGVYPTMYQGFVRLVAEQIGHTLKLVNREDDSGDPGLRTSKLQYKPIGRVHKYLVHVGSPAEKLDEIPVISADGVVITSFRESDKEAYLAMNTDVDNNRFWGYDYREDAGITTPIDENTFYDFAMYDMRVGDSINFAIRESENGDMIGEGILWNFAADGSAELGCRLLPQYHGKGYGKVMFGTLADFAEKTLNLKVWARCYHQNEASKRMILRNNFKEVSKDETYSYFERTHE